VFRNPPVGIDDWPSEEDEPADFTPPGSDIDDEAVGDADRDPEFIERDGPLGVDPNGEPDMDDQELWAYLREHLGDLAEEEWIDICKLYPTSLFYFYAGTDSPCSR
jgi:hypothetical protein